MFAINQIVFRYDAVLNLSTENSYIRLETRYGLYECTVSLSLSYMSPSYGYI